MATTALLVAAILRLPLAIIHGSAERATWFSYSFLGMLVLYDLWSTHKVHRATVAAGTFLIVIEQLVCVVGGGAQSQAFAGWIYSLVR